jgi:hypothetical protein
LPCRKGPIDPHKLIVVDQNSQLVSQPRLIHFVGVPLGAWVSLRLIDMAMSAIGRANKCFVIFVVVISKDNLAKKEKLEMVK